MVLLFETGFEPADPTVFFTVDPGNIGEVSAEWSLYGDYAAKLYAANLTRSHGGVAVGDQTRIFAGFDFTVDTLPPVGSYTGLMQITRSTPYAIFARLSLLNVNGEIMLSLNEVAQTTTRNVPVAVTPGQPNHVEVGFVVALDGGYTVHWNGSRIIEDLGQDTETPALATGNPQNVVFGPYDTHYDVTVFVDRFTVGTEYVGPGPWTPPPLPGVGLTPAGVVLLADLVALFGIWVYPYVS